MSEGSVYSWCSFTVGNDGSIEKKKYAGDNNKVIFIDKCLFLPIQSFLEEIVDKKLVLSVNRKVL